MLSTSWPRAFGKRGGTLLGLQCSQVQKSTHAQINAIFVATFTDNSGTLQNVAVAHSQSAPAAVTTDAIVTTVTGITVFVDVAC